MGGGKPLTAASLRDHYFLAEWFPGCEMLTVRQAVPAALAGIAMMLAIPAGHAQDAATAAFSSAGVKVVAADGVQRELSSGGTVAPGDLVDTGEGRAQLRFTDGAMVSLSPQTQFRIDEYRFAGKPDGNERGFFSLLKGAMRTVTGLVGRERRESYRLNTAVATIGIRGTVFSVSYGNSVTVNTAEGAVEACNSGGCLVIGAGQSGYIKDMATAPVLVGGAPALPQGGIPPQTPGFTAGDQRDPSGNPLNIAPPPPSQGPSCGRNCY
jgi:ferric-dicitrate binding protein FerR (iron transport regulator)